MHRLLICALAILAGCYRPRAEGACTVHCDRLNAPACPFDLDCGADGLCFDDVECSLASDDGGVDANHRDGTFTDTSLGDCYTTVLLGKVCPMALRVGYTAAATIDTANDCGEKLQLGNGDMACLIASTSMVLENTIRILGPYPLVLYSREPLVLPPTAVLDLKIGGAGVGVGCQLSPNGTAVVTSNGGGAGGTLAGAGGDGGAAAGGVAAAAPAAQIVNTLRGGCSGGRGSVGAGAAGGAGGLGGGALQLISPQQVQILGHIDAWGGGGAGASGTVSSSAGGGGGGSGGLVAIDAPMVTFGAQSMVRAHGGGGGGGVQGSATSTSGGPGSRIDGMSATKGVAVGTGCGDGGFGCSDNVLAGTSGNSATSASAGAGGGAGGAGAIFVNTAMTTNLGAQHPLAISGPPAI